MRVLWLAGILGLGLLASGCATKFTGDTSVDGPAECRKKCDKYGMELAGMVAMGSYTDGCLCSVKGVRMSTSDIGHAVLLGAIGPAGGSAGVFIRMQED